MTYSFIGRPESKLLRFRQRFGPIILRALACGLLLSAVCSGGCVKSPYTGSTDGISSSTGSTQQLSLEAKITYSYLVLSDALDKGDHDTARAAVEELVEIAPAPELYIQAAILFERGDQSDKALEIVREGATKYPDDFALHMIWTELLEQRDNQEQALSVLKNFGQRYEKLPPAERLGRLNEISSIRQYTVYLLLNSRHFDEVSAYIKAIPKTEHTPTLLYYEVIMLRNQGQQKQAATKLYELLRNYPDFTDGWLTLAADMEKAGDFKSAARFYNKALESSPITEIYLRMLSAQIKAGDVKSAQNHVIASPFSSEVKTQAAVLFIDSKEYKAARAILLTLQNDPYASDDAAMYLGMIAYDTNENVEEALERLQDISPDDANRARMMHLKALLHIRDNDYPAALEATQALRDEYPDNKDNWAFLAELANVSKKYKLSESISREALEQWPDDVPLMYSLAMSLSFQKHTPQAIQILEDILIQDETNVMAMNALAYTLAEAKTELPRALALARKALAREPGNPSILDTIAWVYYQMENFSEAWRIISLCISKGVEDAVIWDHYGDIALALKNNEAARTGYNNALKMEPDNSADIRKKLRKLN